MDQEEIQQLLQRINEAWLVSYPDQIPQAMKDCFDDRMVIKGPDFQTMSSGKSQCIQSYVDFAKSASLKGCTFSTPQIDVTGDTAVASYFWKVKYEQNGKEHNDTGHDLFVLARSDGSWRAVWRAVFPDTNASPGPESSAP